MGGGCSLGTNATATTSSRRITSQRCDDFHSSTFSPHAALPSHRPHNPHSNSTAMRHDTSEGDGLIQHHPDTSAPAPTDVSASTVRQPLRLMAHSNERTESSMMEFPLQTSTATAWSDSLDARFAPVPHQHSIPQRHEADDNVLFSRVPNSNSSLIPLRMLSQDDHRTPAASGTIFGSGTLSESTQRAYGPLGSLLMRAQIHNGNFSFSQSTFASGNASSSNTEDAQPAESNRAQGLSLFTPTT